MNYEAVKFINWRRSQSQGLRSHHEDEHLQTKPMSIPRINFLFLKLSEIYSPAKILRVKITTARRKVKSISHHDVARLQPELNGPAKCHLPTPPEIQPAKDFKGQGYYNKVKGQIQIIP